MLTAGCCGCLSLDADRDAEAMARRQDMQMLREEMRKLNGRTEGHELELQRLQANIAAMQSEQTAMRAQEEERTRTALDELDRRLRRLETLREEDRKALVETLSARMAEMLKRRPSAAPRASTRSSSGYGYEHIVEPGQTLSAIAQVYGVKAQAIIEANQLKNPDRLVVGQKLFIPE